MEKQKFSIAIDAPKEKVWETLWNDSTYRQWTAPFSPDSHAITDWRQGSKVLFTDGKGSGMVARIAENKPNEFMSIEHLGMVKNGVEDTTSDEVKSWAGAHEDYYLKTVDGKTQLEVVMDLNEEYAAMFKDIWPKALAKLKELAEKN
jgi:uncharacterized protein YndB with AHSA1/START domain